MDYKAKRKEGIALNKKEKAKALVDLFINESYGTTVEHFKIAALIGEQHGTRKYSEIVEMAKKELLDSGKMIANVWGVGYRVVPPDEYTDQSVRRMSIGVRHIDKGVRILDNAPIKDMSQFGVQRYNTISDKSRILQAATHGARVEIKMLNAKRENPLAASLK